MDRAHKELALLLLYIVAFVIFLGVVLFRGMWADESIAVRAAKTQGFTNVEVVDHSYFLVGWKGCSGSDAAKFTIKATNPAGNDVECIVCSGWPFKGATIRTK